MQYNVDKNDNNNNNNNMIMIWRPHFREWVDDESRDELAVLLSGERPNQQLHSGWSSGTFQRNPLEETLSVHFQILETAQKFIFWGRVL